jgi:ribosome maturation factor RimP
MISTEQKNKIQEYLNQAIADSDMFLVEIKFSAADKIEIFLDADNSVTIQNCAKVARYINHNIEENSPELIYELEVSSAGLEHPIKLLRQYKKNVGRNLEVTLTDEKQIEGKLLEANDTDFIIEVQHSTAKSKKVQTTISYNDVKQAFVGVSFK